jgi:hypothetical protein
VPASRTSAVPRHGQTLDLLLEAGDLAAQSRLVKAVWVVVVGHGGHSPYRRKVEVSTLTCRPADIAGPAKNPMRDAVSRTGTDDVVEAGKRVI